MSYDTRYVYVILAWQYLINKTKLRNAGFEGDFKTNFTMKNKVLIIGGSQGLGKVIASEWNEGDEITIVSRYMHRASEVINQM